MCDIAADEELTVDYGTATSERPFEQRLMLLSAGFRAAGHSRTSAGLLAAIVGAQLRGLFTDLDATGDDARIERTFRGFVRLLPAPGARLQ